MRAAVNTRYGGPEVIVVREVPKPEPGKGEVLVKVHATTVSRTDCGQLRAHPFFVRTWTGLRRPKCTILGKDFAGEVEAAGSDVTSFVPGDRVFGLTPGGYGGHAEYLCISEGGTIAHMPAGLLSLRPWSARAPAMRTPICGRSAWGRATRSLCTALPGPSARRRSSSPSLTAPR